MGCLGVPLPESMIPPFHILFTPLFHFLPLLVLFHSFFTSFIYILLYFASFRFLLLHFVFISLHFVFISLHFVFISLHFASFRFISLHFASFRILVGPVCIWRIFQFGWCISDEPGAILFYLDVRGVTPSCVVRGVTPTVDRH